MQISAFAVLIAQNAIVLKQRCVMAAMNVREKYSIVLKDKNVQSIIVA